MKKKMQWRITLSSPPKEETERTTYFDLLPDDVILHIFASLPTEALLSARDVCSRWRALSSSQSLWTKVDVIFEYGCSSPNSYRILKFAPILRSLTLRFNNDVGRIAATVLRIIKCASNCAPQKLIFDDVTFIEDHFLRLVCHFAEKIEFLELHHVDMVPKQFVESSLGERFLENISVNEESLLEGSAYADLVSIVLQKGIENMGENFVMRPDDVSNLFAEPRAAFRSLRCVVMSSSLYLDEETKLLHSDIHSAKHLMDHISELESFSCFYGDDNEDDIAHFKLKKGHGLSLELKCSSSRKDIYWEEMKQGFDMTRKACVFTSVQDFAITFSYKCLSVLGEITRYPNLKRLSLTYCCPGNKNSSKYNRCCQKYLNKLSGVSLPSRRIASQVEDLYVCGCSVFINRYRDALKQRFKNAVIDFDVTVPREMSDTNDASDSSSELASD